MRADLSPREVDVVELVSQGKTNIQIGAELGISASTVKHHVDRSMRKAGVDNRVSLAMWWRDLPKT